MTDALPFYARANLNVETYDVRTALDESGALNGDIEFYSALAERTGGPVLDLGGGTGRVALALAAAGAAVVCLDLSAAMLDRGRAKASVMSDEVTSRVRFVQGDMAAFELPETFGLAIIPFRGFQALLEPTRQRSCLVAIHRHLRHDGILAFHVFDPVLDYLAPGTPLGRRAKRVGVAHPVSGNMVSIEVLERVSDPLTQVFRETWEFVETSASGLVARRERELLSMRWTYRAEMRYLLELTGFAVEAEYGDFRVAPPAYGSEQVYVVRPR